MEEPSDCVASAEVNRVLWLLKASWLEGDSPETQRQVHGIVADWLEEHGRTEEAQVLREGRWWLYFYPGLQMYGIRPLGSATEVQRGWIVHWWPMVPLE